MKQNIINIVAFCALMENGAGIISKSPGYIMEKFDRYCLDLDKENDTWKWGLDKENQDKIIKWVKRWNKGL